MAQGTLEVLLVGAKGLESTDYLSTYAWARLIRSNPSAVSLQIRDLARAFVASLLSKKGIISALANEFWCGWSQVTWIPTRFCNAAPMSRRAALHLVYVSV